MQFLVTYGVLRNYFVEDKIEEICLMEAELAGQVKNCRIKLSNRLPMLSSFAK